MTEPWPSNVRDETVRRAAQIGFAVQAFWLSGFPPQQSWMLRAYVLPAITLRQAKFAFDPAGRVEAVIAWACVSGSTAEALTADPNRILGIDEWNEGEELWVMALFGTQGRSAALLRRMLRGPFSGLRRVRGYQRLPSGMVRRLHDRPIEGVPTLR